MSLFLIALASIAVTTLSASSPSWQMTDLKVTTLTGVWATSEAEAFCAMSDNSLGPGVMHTADTGATTDFIGPVGGMNMDVAYTPKGTEGCVATLSGMLCTHDDSKTFARADDLRGVSQNVEAFGDSSFGSTGSFFAPSTGTQVNGVAVSTDAGVTWSLSDIGLNSSLYLARYGAFPTASTWYVSSGSWPYDDAEALAFNAKTQHRLSSRITLSNDKDAAKGADFSKLAGGKNTKKQDGSGAVTGYPGAISKTEDGGATWTKVFDTDGSMYFNEISCFDVLSCMAVAENSEGAFAVATTDGGASWSTVLTAPTGASLMGCRMISASEGWVSGGGMETGKGLVGYYYHTLDAGNTWDLDTLQSAYSMDLSFNGGVGYSAAINQAYSTLAIYV